MFLCSSVSSYEHWRFCSEKHSHENNSCNQYVPLRSESAGAVLKDFLVASLPSFIRQSRSDQGPTANRNMSSLLVTKTTRAFPLPPGCREIEVLPCGPFPGSRRLSRRMGHGTQALRFYITRSIETFWDFHDCGPVVKTTWSQCRG